MKAGAERSEKYLWSLGHRSVAVMLNSRLNLAAKRREEGLRSFWQEKGVPFQDRWLMYVDPNTSSQSEFRDTVSHFLADDRTHSDPVTAIFCFNDWGAAYLLKELRIHGIRVPDDISVVGFDDSIYAELLDPPLTTVKNPFGSLGEISAQLLLEQWKSPTSLHAQS